jgi:acetyl esterase
MERRLDPDIGRILPVLPLKDAANLTPKRARDELLTLTDRRKEPLPQPAVVVDVTVEGAAGSIPARMYRASTAATATVVFFHGGGWVAGDLYTHDRHLRALSLALDAVVLSVDYRRAPEAPFPAAFEDAVAATR